MSTDIKTVMEVIISRVHGADDHQIEIRFRDKISRIEFLEAHLTLEQFGTALFSSAVDVPVELRAINRIGTTHEWKEQFIPVKLTYSDVARHRALRKYEVDGWKARHGDIDNHHRINSSGVNVVMFRNVGQSYAAQQDAAEAQNVIDEVNGRKP